MTNNDLVLRFMSADRLGQLIRLPHDKCSIGAGENCTLRLSGRGIQPVHCFIVRGPGGAVVRRWSPDTRLNGQPFRDAALRAGDRLSLGPVDLEVVEGTPASPASEELATTALQLAEQQQELDRLREQLQQACEREQHGAERFDQQLLTFAKLQSDWHGERDELVERCNHLQAEIDAALTRAEAANLTRRAVTEAWSPDLADTSRDELDQAQAKLTQAQAELDAAQQAFAEQAADFAKDRATGEAEVAARQRELAQRETELDRLAGELYLREADLERESEKLRQSSMAIEAERAALQQQHRAAHERFDEQLAAATARETALALQCNELQKREAELSRLQGDLQQQVKQFAAERVTLRKEIAQLQSELAESRRAAEQGATSLDAQRGEFDADQLAWQDERHQLATQLDEQQSHLDSLQQELAELRRELDARLASEQGPASPDDDEVATNDDIEATEEVETPELPTPPHSQAASSAPAMSEAMLALQRLREAVQSGEEEDDNCAPSEPVVEPIDETPPTGRVAGDDSDVSIEDYMSKLMQRVRGKSEDELPTPKRKPVAAPPKASPAVASTPPQRPALEDRVVTEAPCKPLETLRSLPTRAGAPEQSGSLQAMRELANQSARTAIDTSSQRRWSNNLRGKIALSITSTASCGLLLSLNTGLVSWGTLGAAGSLALAGVFGWQAWKMKRQGRPSGG